MIVSLHLNPTATASALWYLGRLVEWLHDIMNTHDALRDLLLNLKFSLRRWAKDATSQVLTRTDSFWLPVQKRALFNRRVKHMLMEGLPRDDFRFPTCRRDLNSDLDESGKSKTRTVTELSYDDLLSASS